MTKKVRWGLLSAANITNTFAQDLTFAANAEIVAVAARKLAPARDFAAKYNIARAYEGYDALFDDPDVDAIYVATPHTLHCEHAAAALEAGKAVLCEKPVTVSAEECRSLISTAGRSGSYLMEGMWTWFLPAIRAARQWLDAGRIGELLHIKADFGYPAEYAADSRRYDVRLGGGCLLEMGIYPVAIARFFANRDPRDVQVMSHHAPNGVEDDVAMLFEYEGLLATLATSYRCKLPNFAYIVGSEGWIVIPDFWRARECQLFELDTLVDSFTDDRQGSGFEFQIREVCDDILQGRRQSAVVPHSASLALQQDMDRVRAKFTR